MRYAIAELDRDGGIKKPCRENFQTFTELSRVVLLLMFHGGLISGNENTCIRSLTMLLTSTLIGHISTVTSRFQLGKYFLSNPYISHLI